LLLTTAYSTRWNVRVIRPSFVMMTIMMIGMWV
jgi:hypothetical protein